MYCQPAPRLCNKLRRDMQEYFLVCVCKNGYGKRHSPSCDSVREVEVSVHLLTSAIYDKWSATRPSPFNPWERAPKSIEQKAGGPWSRSGSKGEKNNSLSLLGIQIIFRGLPVHILVFVPCVLPRHTRLYLVIIGHSFWLCRQYRGSVVSCIALVNCALPCSFVL